MGPERRAPLTKDVTIRCPRLSCDSEYAGIRIASATVLTLRCAKCRHMWSVEIAILPQAARTKLPTAS